MHDILTYLLCFSLFILVIISTLLLRKVNDFRKLIMIVKTINTNRVSLNELGNKFHLIFIDPATEQDVLKDLSKNQNSIIFYHAPPYRMALFEKKVPTNMTVCNSVDKKILTSLEIRSFPCLVDVNLNNLKIKKIYGGHK